MVLDFKVERLFVEKQVTFLFLPFSADGTDGTTFVQRKKQTKTNHAILKKPNKCLAFPPKSAQPTTPHPQNHHAFLHSRCL